MADARKAAGSVDFRGGAFVLRFGYDPRVIADVKALPGRRFDKAKKVWTVPGRARVTRPLSQLVEAEGWKLSSAAQKAIARLLAQDADADGDDAQQAGGSPQGRFGGPRQKAGEWLRKYVSAYRDQAGATDTLEALKGLDRIVGMTPFGIHPSGDIGLADAPGVRPLRPSALSHHLSKGARRARRVRRVEE